jgi:mannose-1-phosphate guanylyltransferase/phosphomannomutase
VKAVIMAGGEGTRLRAVTGEMPKPMVPLLGRPMLEHILLLLKNQGFGDVCIALRYRAGDIMDYFGDGGSLGMHIQYRLEEEPLGTAGAVKNCEDFYGDEDFLVISGDAACDFNLRTLMEAHRRSSAAATLALYRSREPLRYGLAVTDEEGCICSFIEKPGWRRVVSDLINTGIYVISPEIMSLVPEGKSFDFAKELFPLLLSRGKKLLGICPAGYWCDVGTPLSYYKCCVDALEGRLKIEPGGQFKKEAETEERDLPREGTEFRDCRCRSRAELMGTLSRLMLDMGADYSDGIRLSGDNYRLHISPLVNSSAVRVAVDSPDAEFARSLALSAEELIRALDM